MLILTMRTDKPEAELELYDELTQLSELSWLAHRELAETLHTKIKELFANSETELKALDGIVIYEGPGSFTGLRIGLSVANSLAYSLKKPIVAKSGKDWIQQGINALIAGMDDKVALPNYGSEPRTTQQRK